jgi:hypothetical protein
MYRVSFGMTDTQTRDGICCQQDVIRKGRRGLATTLHHTAPLLLIFDVAVRSTSPPLTTAWILRTMNTIRDELKIGAVVASSGIRSNESPGAVVRRRVLLVPP